MLEHMKAEKLTPRSRAASTPRLLEVLRDAHSDGGHFASDELLLQFNPQGAAVDELRVFHLKHLPHTLKYK